MRREIPFRRWEMPHRRREMVLPQISKIFKDFLFRG
jgi:hypothetical protein